MKGAWRQSGVAAVVDHLGVGGGVAVYVGRARPARLCLYSLALAFAAFAVLLAFAPSLPAPAPSSPAATWFDGLIASASPYRAQVSGFLSSLFPTNSSTPGPPGGVTARRGGPSGGGFAERGSQTGGNGSIAVRPGEQLGSGDEVPISNTGGALDGDRAPGNATAAETSGVPPNDRVPGSAEAENSTGGTVAEAKGGAEHPSGGSAQIGAAAKGGVPVRINGSDANASSVDAEDGRAVKASARNAAGSTHQLGSGTAALGNVTEAMGGNGAASQSSGAAGNNQTVLIQAPADNLNHTRSTDASDGSNSAANKHEEATTGPQGSASSLKDHSAEAVPRIANNNSAAPVKEAANPGGRKQVDWTENMASCDMFYGNWVQDDSYPLYPAGSCPHVDESFNCYRNGRPDKAYQRLRWQPSGCRIPRLNPIDMLERLRGKRLVFVGDSLNRNMWESLVCILRNSVEDKRKVFEVSGRSQFRVEGSYSFLFQEYNCSVEFFVSPFLVQEWEMPIRNGKGTRETLRLDMINRASPRYKNADIIIFNTGHWWTHDKTALGKDYYQEGNRVYSELDVHDAYRRALNTWAKWVDSNVNPKKTTVFFRGYSASHFSGGQWNSGGSCDKETEPITNEQYLEPYPTKMSILEEVLHGMKTPVVYLNITRMTDYRKEAHPSVYRKQKLTEQEKKSPEVYQDCSHWCLPGVPDSWNELLYAQMLVKQRHTIQQ
ncbi:protein trichome birefringence-like 1 isoform X2 [Phragmites australis]|uniref:protein trichome birefringence-like 1 isoform X2 n=1 Tax=Phragmites australis TaxID=29695 RepID=UPI002D7898D9|nr:protein trichome birefringence-like 1 isoform X2 [Phragmites australis]